MDAPARPDRGVEPGSFALGPRTVAMLDRASIRNICAAVILDGKPLEAWHLLESRGLPGDLWMIFNNVQHGCAATGAQGLDDESLGRATLPLAALILKSLETAADSAGEKTDAEIDGVQHCAFWLSRPKPFVEELTRCDKAGRLPELFAADAFKPTLGPSLSHGELIGWTFFTGAFESAPALWEPAIQGCMSSPNSQSAERAKEGRTGTPGLLLAATFDLGTFERCLDAAQRAGGDKARCAAQKWPDIGEHRFGGEDDEATALTQALASGRADVAARIMELCPEMDPMADAARIRRVHARLSQKKTPERQQDLATASARAFAIAEALALDRGAKRRQAPSPEPFDPSAPSSEARGLGGRPRAL